MYQANTITTTYYILQLLPLMHWFEFLDVMFLIKCIKDPPDNFNIFEFVQFVSSSTRSGSNNKLVINLTRSSKVRHFYFNRIARLWNRLPHTGIGIDLSLSFLAIKHRPVGRGGGVQGGACMCTPFYRCK